MEEPHSRCARTPLLRAAFLPACCGSGFYIHLIISHPRLTVPYQCRPRSVPLDDEDPSIAHVFRRDCRACECHQIRSSIASSFSCTRLDVAFRCVSAAAIACNSYCACSRTASARAAADSAALLSAAQSSSDKPYFPSTRCFSSTIHLPRRAERTVKSYPHSHHRLTCTRVAAVRKNHPQSGIEVSPGSTSSFDHWTPWRSVWRRHRMRCTPSAAICTRKS